MSAISRRLLITAAPAVLLPALRGAGTSTLVVSKSRSRFRTVQDAIDAIPRGNRQPYTIEIRKGIYFERVTVPRDKPFIRLVGEDAHNTVLDRCYIEGHVDFIFGDAAAVFRECQIHSKGQGCVTAQSRTYSEQASGFVFERCRLTGENKGRGIFLGRPWRACSQVIYRNCWLGAHIRPEGWSVWNNNNNHETSFYAESQSEGPGANPAARVPWSHQLTAEESARFALPAFLQGADNWNPGGTA